MTQIGKCVSIRICAVLPLETDGMFVVESQDLFLLNRASDFFMLL